MDRRAFLTGLVATAGGLLVPELIVTPERRWWELGMPWTPRPDQGISLQVGTDFGCEVGLTPARSSAFGPYRLQNTPQPRHG